MKFESLNDSRFEKMKVNNAKSIKGGHLIVTVSTNRTGDDNLQVKDDSGGKAVDHSQNSSL